MQGVQQIKEELEKAKFDCEIAQRKGEFERAGELRYSVIPSLEKQIENVSRLQQDAKNNKDTPKLLRNKVTENEIAEVVSRATGIPVAKMMAGEKEKLLNMEISLLAKWKCVNMILRN